MRTCLLLTIALTALSLTACGQVVTGPKFKTEVPKGGTYFGEVFSPTAFSSASPLKVPVEGTDGFFLVVALDGSMYTFDADQGKRREKRPWAKLPKGVRGTPIFEPTNKQVLVGSYDRKVHALDMLSGAEHWYAEVDGYVQAPLALVGSTAIASTLSGTVYGIASIDGSKLWEYKLGGEIYGQAGVHLDWPHRALVGNSNGRLAVLDVTNGQEVATFEAGSGLHAGTSIAVVNGEVRGFFGTDAGDIQAWDLTPGTTPARLWSGKAGGEVWAPPAIAPRDLTAPTWADAVVYGVTVDSNVVAYDASSGTILWTVALAPKDRLHATPLIVGPNLYVGSLNHHLYCLNRADGTTKWDYEAFGEFRTAPLLDADRIIAVSNDHFLYALAWDTGDPIIGTPTLAAAPPVLDLTLPPHGVPTGTPAEEIDETLILAEVTPMIEALLSAVSAGDQARIAPFLAENDPAKQSIYAAAVDDRFAEFSIQQHEVRTVIPATAGDIVAVINVGATESGKPVRMVLTLHLLKDASQTQTWRVEPESLKPENVIPVPVVEP